MENKYLPIGTVVLLKGGSKKVMINGYCVTVPSKKEVFDYRGCPFPEGILESNGVALFNHNQIEEVCHIGFKNDESINFLDKLEILTSNEE